MEHAITVGELKRLLADLDDSLVLRPNTVGNLMISDGDKYVGFIDLLEGQGAVEMDEPK